ncbi:hypothetical protein P7K49_024255 [Saguinus oedipus]|uniref:Uncharacterized protein n=1 Tax=Saguinus oedipus TaxID=9490 RepID=A0ABQ9UNZ9_SAGOE|nr:hypothetical protein P7K49_024255 [Saguinus oedipus]
MCETHKAGKEREVEDKRHWDSSSEHEDYRSLRKRKLMVLDGLYRENDLDPRYWAKGQHRPYRKRDCGYWDFEQSEPSYMDSGEAHESEMGCVYHRDHDGYRSPENVDDENPSPGTKDNSPMGSPDVTWKAGGYGEANGYPDCKNLNYNPEDSEKAKQWTGCRSLDDSSANLVRPRLWYIDHRNVNHNLEDCQETNFYYREHSALYHVPGNYPIAQSVSFSDLNGVNEDKKFIKYHEGDRNVYQNDKIYPKAKTHTMDQGNFDIENKGYDALFANCVYESRNSRGTDSLHQMENLEYNGIDIPRIKACGGSGILLDGLQIQCTKGDQGECHLGIPQSSSLKKNIWHLEEERKLNGPETWRRNSCLRRTAPSTLRRSEFLSQAITLPECYKILQGNTVKEEATPLLIDPTANTSTHSQFWVLQVGPGVWEPARKEVEQAASSTRLKGT